MGAHTKLKEGQFVINYFHNGKSLREVAEFIQRSRSTVQRVGERYEYKKRNRFTSNLRKSIQKLYIL
jgi:transposase